MTTEDRHSARGTKGRVLHSAAGYDLLAWLLLLGRERAFRERLVELARLEPGESVLDIGCGTGSLAIAAKRRVGPSGSVEGLDASPEMIARAKKKAAKAGADVTFPAATARTTRGRSLKTSAAPFRQCRPARGPGGDHRRA